MVNINIKYTGDVTLSVISMNVSDTIDQMKDNILALTQIPDDIPKNKIVLIFNNQRLRSDKTLSYYNITDESTVMYAYAKNPKIIAQNI